MKNLRFVKIQKKKIGGGSGWVGVRVDVNEELNFCKNCGGGGGGPWGGGGGGSWGVRLGRRDGCE